MTDTASLQAQNLSAAAIFNFGPYKQSTKLPYLSERLPLSMFVHADIRLLKHTRSLKSIRNQTSFYFKKRLEKVHESQRLVLAAVYLLHLELDNDQMASREYRALLPAFDRSELENCYSENIMFAAEALTRGFRIRGIEGHTAELLQPAQLLCATFEATRFFLRQRAERSIQAPYNDCFELLIEFDKAWTSFESKICSFYFMHHENQPNWYEQLETVQILLSETIIYAINKQLLSQDMLDSCDPAVIVGIPRLCIVYALTSFTNFLSDVNKTNMFFKEDYADLTRIKQELDQMSCDQLRVLEQQLIDGDGTFKDGFALDLSLNTQPSPSEFSITKELPTLPHLSIESQTSSNADLAQNTSSSHLNPINPNSLYISICLIADKLQSGPKAKFFVQVLGKVFKMHQ